MRQLIGCGSPGAVLWVRWHSASPEQFEDAALDVRADIYSLGATVWFRAHRKNAVWR